MALNLPAAAVKLIDDAVNRAKSAVSSQPSFPQGRAAGEGSTAEATMPVSAAPIRPGNLIVIAGKAIDFEQQCGVNRREDGSVSIKCVGESGAVLAGIAIAHAAALGIAGLANAVSKNPRRVWSSDFPEVGLARIPRIYHPYIGDKDRVELQVLPASVTGRCRLTLVGQTPSGWMKSLQLVITDTTDIVVSTKGSRRQQSFDFPEEFLGLGTSRIILGKAKLFGVLTQMYELRDLAAWKGYDMTFTWIRD